MSDSITYAQMLRPIGQILESQGIQSFSLTVEDAALAVRCRRPTKPKPTGATLSLSLLWRSLRGVEDASMPAQPSEELELRYTWAEIERLDAEGRARRRNSAGAAEAHSLSQILRAAGSLVDQKEGRLVAIRKDGPNIVLEYESAAGAKVSQQFSVSELYDFWVKMYLKRGDRAAPKG